MSKMINVLSIALFIITTLFITTVTTQNTIINPPTYISLKHNFPNFQQEQKYYCVPASVKSIISYINNNDLLSQDELANEMKTNDGTLMENAIPILNKHINLQLHPNFLEYQNYVLEQNFGKKDEQKLWLQNLVKLSLKNDMPVILGIKGSPPWWPNSQVKHVVIIIAILIDDNPDETIYYVSDAFDGTTNKTFTGHNLINMFTIASANLGAIATPL